MSVTLEVKNLDKFFNQAQKLPDVIQAGVKVAGRSALRGSVWEFGWINLDRVGPKTLISTNPNGETRVLTITAPHGWIRVNKQRYVEALKKEVSDIDWAKYTIQQWPAQIKKVLRKVSRICADIMIDTAPEDTGQLKSDISLVEPDDPILQQGGNSLELGNF